MFINHINILQTTKKILSIENKYDLTQSASFTFFLKKYILSGIKYNTYFYYN